MKRSDEDAKALAKRLAGRAIEAAAFEMDTIAVAFVHQASASEAVVLDQGWTKDFFERIADEMRRMAQGL